MDVAMTMVAVVLAVVLLRGWRRWPQELSPAHDVFRRCGASEVFECDRVTGQKVSR